MPSIDFSLPLLEQLYVLPHTELLNKEQKKVILEFGRCHYLVFFRKEALHNATGKMLVPTQRDMILMIAKGEAKPALLYAVDNLLKEAEKLDSQHIIKRLSALKEDVVKKELSGYRLFTHKCCNPGSFTESEKQLNIIITFLEASLSLDMLPISQVAEIINVSSDTIKQACQDGRLIARKSYKSWSVSLEEAKDYWIR